MVELRQYQTDCLQAIRATVRGGVKRMVVQAPTGSGKTRLAAEIIGGAIGKGNRVAFVVDAISLVDQSVEAFHREGITEVGVIQANHGSQDWSKPVQVCSIQTLGRRKILPEAQVVIIDEVHRLHEAHKLWLSAPNFLEVPFIGLSATPWTRGLGKYFHTLLIAAETKALIEQGYLSPFRVFATGHPDLSKVRTIAGDYHEGELSTAMQQGKLTADIVRTWQEKWGQDKTLIYAVDCAHAENIRDRFVHHGIPCAYQDADTAPAERAEIKRQFHNGEIKAVASVGTLTTGIDWDVRCLVLARPTKSEMLYVQIIGRALRTAEGKDAAIILDHSDTTERLGFVTEIHHEQLDDGKSKKKAAIKLRTALPIECKQCAYLKPPRTPICPNCGHENKVLNALIEREGELQEIEHGKLRQRAAKREMSLFERETFYRELLAYARQHDYKDGWASNKYREKFGTWPRHGQPSPAQQIDPATISWIRSRQIAWAKAKRHVENIRSRV